MKRKLSLNQKIIFGFVFSGILSATLVSVLTSLETTEALVKLAKEKLVSTRESRAFQLEWLYGTMSGQVKALSINNMTVEAIENLENSFTRFSSESSVDRQKAKSSLAKFYNSEFGVKFESENGGKRAKGLDSLIEDLGENAVELQHSYISANRFPLGEKNKLQESGDGSSYSKLHSTYHPAFEAYLKQFGYYDIFLVSNSGDVVYSVFKELDFATNLRNGPYAETGLGKAFKGAMSLPRGESFVTDMDKYFPSYDSPAQFISSPVFDGDKRLGALVFQIPVEKIDRILTGDGRWVEQGQGASGETYIVAKDKTMRSVSRSLIQDKKGYLKVMAKMGVDQSDLDYMEIKDTSALVTKVDTEGVRAVTNGKKGFGIFPDYRGVNVLSAYKPLAINGLEWFILSEMDEDEALESVALIEKEAFFLVVLASLINLILAFFFSRTISRKLVELSSLLRKGAESLLDSANEISAGSEQLSAATQQQSASIQETSSSINEISAMVKRSADSAKGTAELSNQSQQNATQGKKKVENLKRKIEEIHQSNISLVDSVEENSQGFENIKKIIEEIDVKTNVINEIVFQTKLLSFNASVEAARAGEHGKGFAVVAEEIGALAQMSGKAASEISELLDKSTHQVSDIVESSKRKISAIVEEGKLKVEDGLKEVSETDKIIESIVDDFMKVNSSVQEISDAAGEQSAGINEINQAINQLDSATRQNSDVANSSSAKAASLKKESSSLGVVVKAMQEIVFGSKVSKGELFSKKSKQNDERKSERESERESERKSESA